MHSGGRTKIEPFEKIYIEAPRDEALSVFYSRFGRNPYNITCSCCGGDYAVDEDDSIELATAFHRDAKWNDVEHTWDLASAEVSLADYIAREDVLVIRASEILPSERNYPAPSQDEW